MGREKHNETSSNVHYTKMTRELMETPAWRALSPKAQALYPWIKMEWKGARFNNNGRIRFSVRDAADAMGIAKDTAATAFHELQAKGFIFVLGLAHLGVRGHGTSHTLELTEIPLPSSDKPVGRKLFKSWKPGQDFEVQKAATHNPRGKNETLSQSLRRGVPKIRTSK